MGSSPDKSARRIFIKQTFSTALATAAARGVVLPYPADARTMPEATVAPGVPRGRVEDLASVLIVDAELRRVESALFGSGTAVQAVSSRLTKGGICTFVKKNTYFQESSPLPHRRGITVLLLSYDAMKETEDGAEKKE